RIAWQRYLHRGTLQAHLGHLLRFRTSSKEASVSRRFALLLLLLVPGPLAACLWDTDTLRYELKSFPEVVQVISGRFERNPPYYYEMRLQRAAAEIEKHPDHLDAYDDAGVACDRLGRGDEAIEWMEKKRKRLKSANANDPKVRDHRYRYLANVGTFWAHHWFRSGADRDRIDELKTGRDFIKQAIELNPDAHFGREKYQLMVMEWLIAPPSVKDDASQLPDILGVTPDNSNSEHRGRVLSTVESEEAIKGLTGLIVLGDAWQSVDVFHALSLALFRQHKRGASYLAHLRCCELIDQGRRSALPRAPTGEKLKDALKHNGGWYHSDKALADFRSTYQMLREEADRWQQARQGYMMTRLIQGRHPDTDSTFWAEYKESPPPSLPDP